MEKNLVKTVFNPSNNLNEATANLFHSLNIELKQ